MKLKHEDIWNALYSLIEDKGLCPTKAARESGIHSTSLNRSKMVNVNGRERWISLENLVKVLTTLNVSLEEYAMRVDKIQHH